METTEETIEAPVSMELILDGAAFIKTMGAEPGPELHREKTSKGDFLIKEVGHGVGNEVIVGQYRRTPDGGGAFDGIATMDRCICMALHQCVVKQDGTPLWNPANIAFMYTGDKQAQFRDLLTELYDLVIKWNPHLHPGGNPTALRRLRPWLA